MHELSIIQGSLDAAVQAAKANGATQIHLLKLRVGVMTGVVPEALEYAWEVARAGTMAAEARLEVESVAAVCWCPDCQAEFTGDGVLYECPKCHRFSSDLRRGTELELASMEIS